MSAVLLAPFLWVEVEPLRQSAFLAFGTVIENPSFSTSDPQQRLASSGLRAVPANQGTALKYSHVSPFTGLYDHAPSQRMGTPVMNMFVCAPRSLRAANLDRLVLEKTHRESMEGLLDVEVLERHPFTTQTFIPLGLSAEDTSTRYLVIVAPTLPNPSLSMEARQSAVTSPQIPGSSEMPLSTLPPLEDRPVKSQAGLPDLSKMRAFLAHGAQAVTYGIGTWHAPMAVVGEKKVVFVVTQFANSTSEDCEEVTLRTNRGPSITVAVRKPNGIDFMKSKI